MLGPTATGPVTAGFTGSAGGADLPGSEGSGGLSGGLAGAVPDGAGVVPVGAGGATAVELGAVGACAGSVGVGAWARAVEAAESAKRMPAEAAKERTPRTVSEGSRHVEDLRGAFAARRALPKRDTNAPRARHVVSTNGLRGFERSCSCTCAVIFRTAGAKATMTIVRKSVVLVLGIGSALGACLGVAAHRILPAYPVAAGVFIGERRPPDDMSASEWLIRRSDSLKKRVVHLRHETEVIDTTLGDLGVSIDVAATLDGAEKVGHDGSLVHRIRDGQKARRGEIDAPLVFFVDREKARTFLSTISDRFYKAPVDAKLDIEHKKRIREQDGVALDFEGTIDAIAAARHDDEETIDLLLKAIQAKVSSNDLANVDIEKVLSTFETTFATYGEGVGRSGNIKNAAAKVDGTILLPGQVFSFNDKVGPRSAENGFVMAPEIQGDELVTGYGGGTCQVSSTLHAAALYGALEVLDRQNHSRPSSYVSPGMDATVAYPIVDLKIKNNLSFPIMIHAYLPKPTAIRVELLGGDPVAKVTYAYGVGHVEDFVRRIKVIDYYPPGRVYRKQKGTRGMDVTSVVTVTYFDGRTEERKYFSGYRPSPEVLWVAPGYADKDLPPMPEHAKGVEGQTTAKNDTDALYPM